MRKPLLIFAILLSCLSLNAQTKEIDSLWNSYRGDNVDSNKVKTLYQLSNVYLAFKPDTALILSWQALLTSKKIKFEKGESWACNQMAAAYNSMGNYPRALEYYFKQLRIEDRKYNNAAALASVYMSIGTTYQSQKDHRNALVYVLKADSIINNHPKELEDLKIYSLLNLGDIYEKLNILDKALDVTFRAYSMAEVKNLSFLYGPCLTNLGNIYSKLRNPQPAFQNYFNALPLLKQSGNEDFMCETYLGLAKLYHAKTSEDSAAYFGRLSFLLADKDEFLSRSLDASTFLADLFHQRNFIDSAYHYQEKMLVIKDSIYSSERIKRSVSMSLDEQLRQIEISNEKMQESRERTKKLQLLSIALFLPLLFLITIYLNNRRVRARYVEFAGILSLLLFFEFISILIHPFVMEKTSHMPILELIIFALIAATLTPVHQKIEHWMLHRLSHRKAMVETITEEENKINPE